MKKLLSVLFGSMLVCAMALPVFAAPTAVPQDQTTSTKKAKKHHARHHHAKKAKKAKKAKSSGSGM